MIDLQQMVRATIAQGIPAILEMLIAACDARHEHYKPSQSVFSIWRDVLAYYLPIMREAVNARIDDITGKRSSESHYEQ